MAADPTPVKVRQNKKKTVIFITAAMLILAIAAGIGVKWYRDVQNRVTVSFNTNGGETVEAVTLEKGSVLTAVPCASKQDQNFTMEIVPNRFIQKTRSRKTRFYMQLMKSRNRGLPNRIRHMWRTAMQKNPL